MSGTFYAKGVLYYVNVKRSSYLMFSSAEFSRKKYMLEK